MNAERPEKAVDDAQDAAQEAAQQEPEAAEAATAPEAEAATEPGAALAEALDALPHDLRHLAGVDDVGRDHAAVGQPDAVGDDAVYIGDRLNRRIVRVKLAYKSEATCSIGP